MKRRTRIFTVACLLGLAGACLFWTHRGRQPAAPDNGGAAAPAAAAVHSGNAAGGAAALAGAAARTFPTLNTNKVTYRLANTADSIRQLEHNPRALLLANAFIDTGKPLNLDIPSQLRSKGDPGAYIVQARGQTGAGFRAALQAAGATIVSYIPNNAYLVNLTAAEAAALAGNATVGSVLPYEPYYKLQSTLLGLAVNQEPLPPGAALTLGLFTADADTAEAQLEALGARVIGRDRSAFGPTLRVVAPADWVALADSPVVQFVEPAYKRQPANDLSRVKVGISPDTVSPITNGYAVQGRVLTGANVLVAVDDSGVDSTHPDFSAAGTAESGPIGGSRITGLNSLSDLVDTSGHGTHVAGIIAGNGSESYTVDTLPDTPPEGSVTNADFRGKAPLADIFSLNQGNYSDYQMQSIAAQTNALISNNSWDNGDPDYDLEAASYDAATRDALPYVTGSQPVLFVFAAGDAGNGDNEGQEGAGDTILSPGTAKNVVTVGALEQLRNITNWVTYADGTSNQYWMPMTDSSDQVAWYSSRGNVGIGTEGNYGRFKPDLVSPGTFVVSTVSSEWNTNAYYNVTNNIGTYYPYQSVTTNFLWYQNVSVPANTVEIIITVISNSTSVPFPTNMPIYCQQSGYPDPVNAPGLIDLTGYGSVTIPPGAKNCTITNLEGNGFIIGIADPTNVQVNFDLNVQVLVTNNLGNLEEVFQGMNNLIAPWYRYESGTSMSAADASGVLALIQDYFTNSLQLTPSPALMKAVLINGTRSIPGYQPAVTNGINFEGWGLDNIQDCVPVGGLTYQFNTPGSSFFVDQSPTNALATGDRHTYLINVDTTNSVAANYPLRATLVWTDPPGDPAAAIKLVNSLYLVITNITTGDVFFGNDIFTGTGYNEPWNTNNPANIDTINNVQNILLPPGLGAQYSVTVVGADVNVNAVTAQTNNALGQFAPNVVQDYALVVSVGEGEVTNAFTVADSGIASNPTAGQDVTVVITTNAPLFNQFAGASSPLMGTNTLPLGSNTIWGANGVVTIGQTNQWHFYVVTNTGTGADFTNAAFITFDPSTLSIPRMGTLDPLGLPDATRPEADIDLWVSQDPNITNLSPYTLSNCLAGVSIGGVGDGGASLTPLGTEFVYFTNSSPGQVYYVGVQSEDRMGAEYDFLPLFTDIPFSSTDQNGNQIVNGLLLPTTIPGGNNAHPGVTNIFALAITTMVVEKVTVTNLDQHQNFGDLVGALKFGDSGVILNNHDGFGNTFGAAPIVYDDSRNKPAGTTNSDGPGSLTEFRGKTALGPWMLGILDNSAGGYTGQVSQLTLLIQPHRDLKFPGIIVSVPPGGWFVDYVDVPAGYTNLTFAATNVSTTVVAPPIQMYELYGNEPTLTDYDQEATLTNGTPPGNIISIGPPLAQGQYYVGLYNPNTTTAQSVFLDATLGIQNNANDTYIYTSGSSRVIPDDAVSDGVIDVQATQEVASVSVGFRVDSPRISDYTFTLVSPTGQRILLMENRGGADTNGAGETFVYTNEYNATANGNGNPYTNILQADPLGGTVPITYDFYTVPDEMTIYDDTNPANFVVGGQYFLKDTGLTNNPNGPVTFSVTYPPGANGLVIIMNQFGNPDATHGDAWTYSAGAPITNYEYLAFTDDTNLANVPIKFAQPPFSMAEQSTNFLLCDFDLATNGDYFAPTNVYDAYGGWNVPTNLVTITTVETNGAFIFVTNTIVTTNNLVSVIAEPSSSLSADTGGTNFLALGRGTITRAIPTIPGHIYNVNFWYRGAGIAGWWRGEGNASDSSDPENLANNGTLIGRFNFPAGEVDQAFQFEDTGNQFQFAGTNTYIQVPASPSLNVGAGGGFTIEGWINPTNLAHPQPLFEWLARVPTNSAVTNIVIVQGPVLDPANGNYYYLLGATNWATSALWAQELGGNLATVVTANEENWIYDTFTAYGAENRYLWIGFTNNDNNAGWISGSTNLAYTNWIAGGYVPCNANQQFTLILSPTNAIPGLWSLADSNGIGCTFTPTNIVYGVVEVSAIPTNGVQFWISGTNWTPGQTNALQGCLYANIVDTNYVSHQLISAPGLLTNNVFQHVALTYNTNSGIVALFLNGTNVASTNLGGLIMPKTDGDLLIGWDMSQYTNNFYGGEMDEMSLYSRALTLAEISAIYHCSADTTNRLIGKFDPAVTPEVGLAEALVTWNGQSSNVIQGVNGQWNVDSFTFNAESNSMPLVIQGIEPGILLDSFTVSEAPETNLYYLPEQDLSALNGTPADGDWTLQIWDNRAGAYVTNGDLLLSWQLSFVLVSNAVISASLPPETPVATTVSSGQMVDYSVTVPNWAHVATNIIVSSDEPVAVYYNTNTPPTGTAPPDLLLTPITPFGASGAYLAPSEAIAPVPLGLLQLIPGQTYYLGVSNAGPHAASVTLEVDYDILNLTNGVPYTGRLNTNDYDPVRFFSYDVSSNAYEATFQLLQLDGNADLVVSKGVPLPNLTNAAYGSFNVSNLDEDIYVLTNSAPVPLSAGRWYLGVYKRDAGFIDYTVLAKELDYTNGLSLSNSYAVINLTNGVPFNWTAGPGDDLTNFFHFYPTNAPVIGTNNTITNIPVAGVRFELYNLTGNGDLTLQSNAVPLSPPFFQTSQNPGRGPQLILLFTNNVLTNLSDDWYLGVPNNESNTISYTIVAEVLTNSYFPAFPGAEGAGGGATGGRFGTVYHVTTTADSGYGSLRDAVSAPGRTIVFDVAGVINLLSELVITNSNLTLAGQTSPGGITVAGNMTSWQSVQNVIVRDLRFRRGSADDSFQFLNSSNVIADHIAAEWTSDSLVSVLNSSNVTVQWSMMADDLYNTNYTPVADLDDYTNYPADGRQGDGSLLRRGGGQLTFSHNLYANDFRGGPRLGDNLALDFENNVIYNWGYAGGLSGGTNDVNVSTNGCTNTLNYVCNYLIAGPDTAIAENDTDNDAAYYAFWAGPTNGMSPNGMFATWIYQTNNFIDADTNGVLNGANTGWAMFNGPYTPFGREFSTPPVTVDEAFLAYEKVLDFAGVDLALRDFVDTNIVNGVRFQNGRLITYPPLSGMLAWWKGESNTLDSVGVNNGMLMNGAGYAPGEVGTGFEFSDPTQFFLVQTTNTGLDIGQGSGFTIEAWINPSDISDPQLICEYENILASNNGNDVGVQFGINGYSAGDLDCNIKDTSGNDHAANTSGGVLANGGWQHVALTYDETSGIQMFFLNGVLVSQSNIGSFRPQTTFTNFLTAKTVHNSVAMPNAALQGGLDELSLYKRALSSNEVAAIYLAGSAGKFMSTYATYPPTQPYLDSDQDGLPDWWEATFTTNLLYIPSNNDDRDGDGYTDLEEYDNWLAAPHALTTVTNPVTIDLNQMCGGSGNFAFGVTNSVNGIAYLTNVLGAFTNTSVWSNSFAVFVPTNNAASSTNFFGYASFGVYVTNLDTSAYIGPVPVSVIVSAIPLVTNRTVNIITLTNEIPYSPPGCNPYGSDYYHIYIPTNEAGALFELDNPTGPMALVVSYGQLPSLSAFDYYTNQPPWPADLQISVLTNSTPVPLTNGDWYLAAVNENPGGAVCYSAKVTYLANLLPPQLDYPTNTTVITNLETVPMTITIQATDQNIPPFPLSYALVTPPAGMTITNNIIYWTPTEAQGPSTNQLGVSVSNGSFAVTNTFTIIVEESNLPPVFNLTNIPNQVVEVPNTFVFTNGATDPDIPANTLTYLVYTTPDTTPNAPAIDVNGVITWTPTLAQAGSNYVVTTVVTDFNPWAVNTQSFSVTNTFNLFVVPPLPPGPPETNTVPPFTTFWYAIDVPPNAILATNFLDFATAPVNLLFSTNLPPTTGNPDDATLLTGSTGGSSVIGTNTTPLFVPGSRYYLGVQNNNPVAVTEAVHVVFDLAAPPPLVVPMFVTYTNLAGTNGWLVTWYAPTNDQFHLQWTKSLFPANWGTFKGVISFDSYVTATNSHFSYFDNGSQSGSTNGTRFYRLELLNSPTNTAPYFLNSPVFFTAYPLLPFAYNNAAADWDIPAQTLAYFVTNSLGATNVFINAANGTIAWTPAAAQGGQTNFITTVVSDNGVPPKSATNTFAVFVVPDLTPGGPPFTNTVPSGGGIAWFAIDVPTNAILATNLLDFASAAVDLWFSTNQPPTISGPGDAELLANSVGGASVIGTNTAPLLVPGSRYYLGVQNNTAAPVTDAVQVNFDLVNPPPLIVPMFVTAATNAAGTNGWLVTWYAPVSDQFHLQWSRSLFPANWTNFNGVVSFSSYISAATSRFSYFDDGSQSGAGGAACYYRLLFLNPPTNTAPYFLSAPGLFMVNPLSSFVYTNAAADWDIPAQSLTYSVANLLSDPNVFITSGSGIVSWTPTLAQRGQTNFIYTTVWDNGVPAKFAANSFEVIVTTNVAPPFSSVAMVAGGVNFTWLASTNEQFRVAWATNITPPVTWQPFPNVISSTTGNFSFIDTNTPLLMMKFYELMLYP